ASRGTRWRQSGAARRGCSVCHRPQSRVDSGPAVVLAPWWLVSGGQDDGAVSGDCDRVLGVSGPAAVGAAESPAVGADAVAVLAPGQAPRLAPACPPPAPPAAPRAARGGPVWAPGGGAVPAAPSPPPPDPRRPPRPPRPPRRPARRRYVPDPRAGHGRCDARAQRRFGGGDQPGIGLARRPDRERR